ncbi:MAG: M15 family metallopeptidase [Flavobacteriales bacterium]|tara:strand:- start:931 stop:1728 length:798 start_codon:yes stop_codon:yes gene_type:complete
MRPFIFVLAVTLIGCSTDDGTENSISIKKGDTAIFAYSDDLTDQSEEIKMITEDCPNTAFLVGKIDIDNSSLVKISTNHGRSGIRLDSTVYEAFIRMSASANKNGINLYIISAFRSFDYQKGIWERKWELNKALDDSSRARKILEYSSMPGISRHHWGTDIDLNNLENSYFDSGIGLEIFNWLQLNAGDFGFYQPYTSKVDGRTGFEEEKWHWSYFPLSDKYLKYYSQDDEISDYINGFNGHHFYQDFDLLSEYVQGVASSPKLN